MFIQYWLLIWLYILIPYEIQQENLRIQTIIETQQPEIVTLTTYKANENETDSTPLITASGFTLDSVNPKKHRVIAISRDLREKFGFGDKVKLENAGKFNGIWFIRDLMHKKWKKRIDILINPNEIQTSLPDVIIAKI